MNSGSPCSSSKKSNRTLRRLKGSSPLRGVLFDFKTTDVKQKNGANTKIRFKTLLSEIQTHGANLTDNQLKKLSITVNKIRDRKYKRRQKSPLPENVPKAPTPQEAVRFLQQIENKDHKLFFLTQMILGLRASEPPTFKINNLNPQDKTILYYCQKLRRWEVAKLPDEYLNYLINYILHNEEEIKERKGAIFKHTTNYYRMRFYIYARKAGILKLRGYDRAGMPRYNYATHGFRRFAGTELFRATGDLDMSRILLKHKSLKQTSDYIQRNLEKFNNDVGELDKVFIMLKREALPKS